MGMTRVRFDNYFLYRCILGLRTMAKLLLNLVLARGMLHVVALFLLRPLSNITSSSSAQRFCLAKAMFYCTKTKQQIKISRKIYAKRTRVGKILFESLLRILHKLKPLCVIGTIKESTIMLLNCP
jgi:hypothetical protein